MTNRAWEIDQLTGLELESLVCGVDLVEIKPFERHLSLGKSHFLRRVYLPSELVECEGNARRLATRFAGKEAAAKALGTGIRGIGWKEIEIIHEASGRPQLKLHGRALVIAEEIGVREWAVSLSHGDEFALAFVVGR